MKSSIIIAMLLLLASAVASCSGSEEQRRESHMAEDIGRKQAIELAGVIASDTLGAELLIIDVRAREAELRRRGAGKVADSYIGAFLNGTAAVRPAYSPAGEDAAPARCRRSCPDASRSLPPYDCKQVFIMVKDSKETFHTGFAHNVFFAARQAIRRHASGGNVLIFATVAALVVANIPALTGYYSSFWTQEVRLQLGDFNVFSHGGHPMSLLEFINDALMAVFFFTIGLEIKREVLVGELSSLRQALLPIIGAIGGMIVPVALFMFLSRGTDYSAGAAIPMATDIAFSLGLLGMLGSRVPLSLKIFLTTLAVVDDIGGILVIAVCYSTHIEVMLLVYAAVLLAVLVAGSLMRIQSKIFYLLTGGAVWFLFLNSGIHPTIAGVLVAFCIPARPVFNPRNYIKSIRSAISNFRAEDDETLSRRTILTHEQMDWLKQVESASDKVISPLQELEDSLHPIVNYFIVPLFAFANAGITLLDMSPADIFEGVSLAIIISLVVGKFLGIWLFSLATVKLRIAPAPVGANLSFPGVPELLNLSKLGIVVGSVISALLGMLVLRLSLPRRVTAVTTQENQSNG